MCLLQCSIGPTPNPCVNTNNYYRTVFETIFPEIKKFLNSDISLRALFKTSIVIAHAETPASHKAHTPGTGGLQNYPSQCSAHIITTNHPRPLEYLLVGGTGFDPANDYPTTILPLFRVIYIASRRCCHKDYEAPERLRLHCRRLCSVITRKNGVSCLRLFTSGFLWGNRTWLYQTASMKLELI